MKTCVSFSAIMGTLTFYSIKVAKGETFSEKNYTPLSVTMVTSYQCHFASFVYLQYAELNPEIKYPTVCHVLPGNV